MKLTFKTFGDMLKHFATEGVKPWEWVIEEITPACEFVVMIEREKPG